MGIRAHLKQTMAQSFPSLWVHWRLMHRPRSAEVELSLLKNIVQSGDVTVDVGANLGLYTRALAGLSHHVHAFEPSQSLADILRRTSANNVTVHRLALSDGDGDAELRIPRDGAHLSYGLASLEPHAVAGHDVLVQKVPLARLDVTLREDVSFVKVDVEGHELHVLRGARRLIDRCRPVFLVEAEERHRAGATTSLFEFFSANDYDGFYLRNHNIFEVDSFDARADQDENALLSDGARQRHRHYINNFFFFPSERKGRSILSNAL